MQIIDGQIGGKIFSVVLEDGILFNSDGLKFFGFANDSINYSYMTKEVIDDMISLLEILKLQLRTGDKLEAYDETNN